MKKLVFLMMLLGFTATSLSAQKTCSKSEKKCSKPCVKKATDTGAKVLSMADELAKEDASIERRICAKSGKVSYFQKTTCPTSGKMKISEVKYCEKSKSFVNVGPNTDSRSIAERVSPERTTLVKSEGEELDVPKTRTQLEKSEMKKTCAKSAAGKSCCKKGEAAKKCSKEQKAACSKSAEAGKTCAKQKASCSKASATGEKKACCKDKAKAKSCAGTKKTTKS